MRLNEFDIFEVSMAPKALASMSSKIDATVGIEFEMYVPDSPDRWDIDDMYEEDFDENPEFKTIDDIEGVFSDTNDASVLKPILAQINEEYIEYIKEYLSENKDYFRQWIINNGYWNESDAITRAKQIADQKNKDENSYDYKTYIDMLVRYDLEKFVYDNTVIDSTLQDNFIEFYKNNYDLDDVEQEFLDTSNLSNASDVYVRFSGQLVYPFTKLKEHAIQEAIAKDFSQSVRMAEYVFKYHGARFTNKYSIEPDGSLKQPPDYDMIGLEFVSPPLTLSEMKNDIYAVYSWARYNDCATNKTTGLHINVSIPNYSVDTVDYLKLAIFVGDQYILDQFDRMCNEHCESAISTIIDRIENTAYSVHMILDVFKKMHAGMTTKLSKDLFERNLDKYTSINLKSDYIEFRGAGGDWLEHDLDKIINIVNRYVVALDIACDQDKYKKEYTKKLYKMLSPLVDDPYNDIIKLFATYSSGDMSMDSLKTFVKHAQWERARKAR